MFSSRQAISALFVISTLQVSLALPLRLRNPGSTRSTKNSVRGYDIPITTFKTIDVPTTSERDGITSSTGLGDNVDLIYTVPIKLGDTVVPLHLDTGSSDLWVISNSCTTEMCTETDLPRYSLESFNASGSDVTMRYGDSKTGTYATGPVGSDLVTIGGVAMDGQQFAAINSTNNPTIQFGASGIFGLGFPSGSVVQSSVVHHKYNSSQTATTDLFLKSTLEDGPLLARMAMTGELEKPMFAVTLQRNTVDIGGNGTLSIGKLPEGFNESDLTWVPVRMYRPEEGGMPAPLFAPNETYPFRWEIDIDGVYLDGKELPESTIPAKGITVNKTSALIDTGNSLIRGPADVVSNILNQVSPSYASTGTPSLPCTTTHSLAFKIGGKMFPVNPADFISPYSTDATTCEAGQIVTTDPPSVGALFRWSLGEPFLKSNLVAFYYGNLTHPSVDPPRIGFLSTVSANAEKDFQETVAEAKKNGGLFEIKSEAAPTSTAKHAASVTISVSEAEETNQFIIPKVAQASPQTSPRASQPASASKRIMESSATTYTKSSMLYAFLVSFSLFALM